MKKILFLVLGILLLSVTAAAQNNTVEIYLFYGKGCPHCEKAKQYLDSAVEQYPTLNIIEKETYFNQSNRALFIEMAEDYGVKISGVPTIFIDDKTFAGFSNSIRDSLDKEIRRCLKIDCGSPLEHKKTKETMSIEAESSPLEDPAKTQLKQTLTIPAVLSAAAVDAINPCAFAVLIVLLTTILATNKRKRALGAGLAFTLSIFISYVLMGLGLYSAIGASGLTHTFYTIVAVLAILIGLFNLKDYFWYGKWFITEVPRSWRPKLKTLLKGVTSIPGAFLIGFAVSLFLLPCTSGPYIVILGLLAKTATKDLAYALLLLYNFIFIMPMLIITFAVYFGLTTTEKAEEWRKSKLQVLHLIAGIILVLLGIGMFIAMHLGAV